jgi:hypothetical protein
MQRLRRIKQLGGTNQVYHAAEHSRFSHSLGVYEICRRMIEEVESIKDNCSLKERIALLCAALLHDLGHGPLSHFFEKITKENHEQRTVDLILDPKGNVYQILCAEDQQLPFAVAAILQHQSKCYLQDMISSQLDCDRMDYLLRDAYETGTSYGKFDLERVLRTLRIFNETFCIKKSGMHSIEDYIMARYQMYWQVYLHPDSYGYELMVQRFFERYEKAREIQKIDLMEIIYENQISNAAFLQLDDGWLTSCLHAASVHTDPVLQDLARRILNRQLPAWIDDASEQMQQRIKTLTKEAGFDPECYFHVHCGRYEDLLPYRENEKQSIQVLENETLLPLSKVSPIAEALLKVKAEPKKRIYFPKEIRHLI